MHQLYIVIRCFKVLEEIDKALWTGDLEYLISVSGVEGQLGKLFSKEVEAVYEMPVDDVDEIQGVESSLLLNHAFSDRYIRGVPSPTVQTQIQ